MTLLRWASVVPFCLAAACAQDSGGRSAPSPSAPAPTASPLPPPAKPADVASPEAILAAAYEVISGPAGHPRDWDRFRSLFVADARLIPTSAKEGGGSALHSFTVEGFIARATPVFDKDGFYETETAHRTDRYGSIAQVFSTYESRHAPNAPPFSRGINSFQVFFDGTRWWIVTIYWQPETPDLPIPKAFLPAGP
jgi:hypothetical protein